MRPGQIGRGKFRWIALTGAMLLISACQSTASLDSANPAAKRASVQPAAPILSKDTASFIGLGGADLSRTLGQPKLVRKDAPAEIWQYSGADCVVDFYLYAGATGLAVAYMEARNQVAESTPADRCVKSLLQSVSSENAQQKML
ncbi:hypothetical protein [Dongia deserti]|uniref:hypothetical protein n=1 Tax=Dongia deserti TaxID=2268030 RepID=UPI000E64D690|nr:hypothetical protein [Dongia deserti]